MNGNPAPAGGSVAGVLRHVLRAERTDHPVGAAVLGVEVAEHRVRKRATLVTAKERSGLPFMREPGPFGG